MRRPGFSIIELLIVVGLIAAMAAIVSPIVFDRLRTTREQETVEQVNAAINTARLDARREGRPLLLSVSTEAGGRIALRLKPAEDAAALGRIVLTLPDRFLIERGEAEGPDMQRVAAADDAFVPPPLPVAQERAPEPELLGAFLPDGSAIAPESFVIVAPSGKRTRVRIGAWAGPIQDESDLTEEEEAEREAERRATDDPDADEWGDWLGDPS